MMIHLRDLPSVEQLLQNVNAAALIKAYGRPMTLDAIRVTLDEARVRLRAEPDSSAPEADQILSDAVSHLTMWTSYTLRPVINATGVILHTNLGRAPLSEATIAAIAEVALGSGIRRYDPETVDRHQHLVCEHCGTTRDVYPTGESRLALAASERDRFTLNRVEIVFWGLCPKCATVAQA